MDSGKNSLNNDKSLCLYCDKSFANSNDQENHVEREHKTILKSTKGKGSRKSERITKNSTLEPFPGCFYCNNRKLSSRSDDLESLFQHLMTAHNDVYCGCKCRVRMQDKAALVNHRKNCKIGGGSDVIEDVDDIVDNEVVERVKKKGKTKKSQVLQCDSLSESEDASSSHHHLRTNAINNKKSESFNNSNRGKGAGGNSQVKKKSSGNKLPSSGSSTISSCSSSKASDEYTIPLTRQKLKEPAVGTSTSPQKNISRTTSSNNKKSSKVSSSSSSSTTSSISSAENKSQHANASSSSSSSTMSLLAKVQRTKAAKSVVNSLNANGSGEVSEASASNLSVVKNECASCDFDEDFYKNISNNIRLNLNCFIDGKADRLQNKKFNIENGLDVKQNKIESTQENHEIDEREIHEATNFELLSTPPFPALLTAEQYGFGDCNLNKNKRQFTKNSWKWRWDLIKKYKYVNEGGKIVKKVKQITTGLKDLSQLDMWTQLSMRSRYESLNGQTSEFDDGLNDTLSRRMIKTQNIEQLNGILDKRLTPEINIEQLQQMLVKEELVESDEDNIDEIECTNPDDFEKEDIFQTLRLDKKSNSKGLNPASLSGEWARPRCFVCIDCGQEFDLMKSLNDHKNSEHPYVVSAHYEVVGRENLERKLYKNLFLPKKALNTMGSAKSISINSDSKSNEASSSSQESSNYADQREKECTKCQKVFKYSNEIDIYRHILDCIEDKVWMQAKRRSKYRRSRRKGKKNSRKFPPRAPIDQKKSTSSPITKENTEGDNSTLSISNPPTPKEDKVLITSSSNSNSSKSSKNENLINNDDGMNIKSFFRVSKTTPNLPQRMVVQMLQMPNSHNNTTPRHLRSSVKKQQEEENTNDDQNSTLNMTNESNDAEGENNDTKEETITKSHDIEIENTSNNTKPSSSTPHQVLTSLHISTPEKCKSPLNSPTNSTTSSLVSPTSCSSVPKKKKKLNDCIAMLTCKIQEKLGVNFFANVPGENLPNENNSSQQPEQEDHHVQEQEEEEPKPLQPIDDITPILPSSTSLLTIQPTTSPTCITNVPQSLTITPVQYTYPVQDEVIDLSIKKSSPIIVEEVSKESPKKSVEEPSKIINVEVKSQPNESIRMQKSSPSKKKEPQKIKQKEIEAIIEEDFESNIESFKISISREKIPDLDDIIEKQNVITVNKLKISESERKAFEEQKNRIMQILSKKTTKASKQPKTTVAATKKSQATKKTSAPKKATPVKKASPRKTQNKSTKNITTVETKEQQIDIGKEKTPEPQKKDEVVLQKEKIDIPTETLIETKEASDDSNTEKKVVDEKKSESENIQELPQDQVENLKQKPVKNSRKPPPSKAKKTTKNQKYKGEEKIEPEKSIPLIILQKIDEPIIEKSEAPIVTKDENLESEKVIDEPKQLQIKEKVSFPTKEKITFPTKDSIPDLKASEKKSEAKIEEKLAFPTNNSESKESNEILQVPKVLPNPTPPIEKEELSVGKIEQAIKNTNRIRCRRLSVVVDPMLHLPAFQKNRKIRLTNNSQQNGFYDLLANDQLLNALKNTPQLKNEIKKLEAKKRTISEVIKEVKAVVVNKDTSKKAKKPKKKKTSKYANGKVMKVTRKKKKSAPKIVETPKEKESETKSKTEILMPIVVSPPKKTETSLAKKAEKSLETNAEKEPESTNKVAQKVNQKSEKGKISAKSVKEMPVEKKEIEPVTPSPSKRKKNSMVDTEKEESITPLSKTLVTPPTSLPSEITPLKSTKSKASTSRTENATLAPQKIERENSVTPKTSIATAAKSRTNQKKEPASKKSVKKQEESKIEIPIEPPVEEKKIDEEEQIIPVKNTAKKTPAKKAPPPRKAKSSAKENLVISEKTLENSFEKVDEKLTLDISLSSDTSNENDIPLAKLLAPKSFEKVEEVIEVELPPTKSASPKKKYQKVSKAKRQTPKKDETALQEREKEVMVEDRKFESISSVNKIQVSKIEQEPKTAEIIQVKEPAKNTIITTPTKANTKDFSRVETASIKSDIDKYEVFSINEDSFFNDDNDIDQANDKINALVNNIINSSELVDSENEKNDGTKQQEARCEICNKTFRNDKVLEKHCKTNTHLLKEKRKEKKVEKDVKVTTPHVQHPPIVQDEMKIFRTKGALKTFDNIPPATNELKTYDEFKPIVEDSTNFVSFKLNEMPDDDDDDEDGELSTKDKIFDSLFSNIENKLQAAAKNEPLPKFTFPTLSHHDSESSSASWDLKHDADLDWNATNVVNEPDNNKIVNPLPSFTANLSKPAVTSTSGKTKVIKTKDTAVSIPTKSLIMGKIFKKHRDREKQKTPQADAPNNKPGIKNSLDEIFDHLKNSAEIDDKVLTCPSPKTLLKNSGGTFSPLSNNSNDMLETASQSNNNNNNNNIYSKKSSIYASTLEKISNKEHEKIKSKLKDDEDEEENGIGKRKSRRRCAIKTKTFAETWSSDEYEELHDTNDIISIINEIEKRESNIKKRKDAAALNEVEIASILKTNDNNKKKVQLQFPSVEVKSSPVKDRKKIKDGYKSDDEALIDLKSPQKSPQLSLKKRRMSCFVPSTAAFNSENFGSKSKSSLKTNTEVNLSPIKNNTTSNVKPKSTAHKSVLSPSLTQKPHTLAVAKNVLKNCNNVLSTTTTAMPATSQNLKKKAQKHRKRPRNKVKNIAYDSDSDFELNLGKKKAKVGIPSNAYSDSESDIDEDDDEDDEDMVDVKSQISNISKNNDLSMTMTKEPTKLLPNDLKVVATQQSTTLAKAAIIQHHLPHYNHDDVDTNHSTDNACRTKRHSTEKLYYWSSSSDSEVGDMADGGEKEDSTMIPQQPEQHGWIVGDSHKKLVTLLAHAKIKNKIN